MAVSFLRTIRGRETDRKGENKGRDGRTKNRVALPADLQRTVMTGQSLSRRAALDPFISILLILSRLYIHLALAESRFLCCNYRDNLSNIILDFKTISGTNQSDPRNIYFDTKVY